MSLRTSAKRYARALFDIALQEKTDLAQLDRDLTALASVMRENAELLHMATRHGVPDTVRKNVIDAIADKLGAAPPLRKLLVLLAEGHRLNLVPDLAVAYRERLLAHQNIVHAEVTTAVALSPEKTAALVESLSAVTGKKVDISVRVDADLIGGLVATIGSTVYDGSVRTQLKKMRTALTLEQ